MTTTIVNNQVMVNSGSSKFPGGKMGSLVTGPGFINPDMDGGTGIMGLIHRGKSSSPVHSSQPTCIAMGQNIYRQVLIFLILFNELQTMLTQQFIDLHVLIADISCLPVCRGKSLLKGQRC